MVYQEQVMQAGQILGGYSLGGADLLRRAMGKKKPEEMATHRSVFRDGAAKQAIPAAVADEVFDLMEKFAGYGFNKSHAAAYALVSYQTAWLKTHHPAEFMAAVLSSDMDNTDKVVGFLDEARALGFPVFAKTLTAKTARGRIVELGTNVPVTFESVTVTPGDYVIADKSAVIFISAADIARVLDAAETIAAKEAAMAARLREGEPISQVMAGNYETMLTR
jgi:hypothetical protein